MSENPESQPPLASIHPEVWDAAKPAWESGLVEHAVFDAFKRVEFLIQSRIKSAAIGNTLIEAAFAPSAPSPRVDISANPLDMQRLAEIFRGSIGLFKGARSHGQQRPSIPAKDDPEFALRLLALASVLVDLLDKDALLAPGFLGNPQVHEKTLTIWAERLDTGVHVLIDGQVVTVVSHIGNSIQVSLDGVSSGTHEIVLETQGHRSKAEHFEYSTTSVSNTWHRVLANGLQVFADANCTKLRPERAILLESLEGGHRYRRVFPSASTASPQEYVSSDWILTTGVEESWVRIEGTVHYGWTSSTFFAGRGTPPVHRERITRLSAHPAPVSLRPGRMLPLRVVADVTDGVGVWQEDVADHMKFGSSDESSAFVDSKGTVRAKKAGSCRVRIDGFSLHTQVSVVVASHAKGTRVEYIGGLFHPRSIALKGNELVIVNNSDTVWIASDQKRLAKYAAVPQAYLATSGLDIILASPSNNLAVRDLSTNRFLCIPAFDPTKSMALELPNKGVTPMAAAWSEESLAVLDHTGGVWLFGGANGIDESSVAQFLWKAPSNPISACVDGDLLLVATGGNRPLLHQVNMSTGIAEVLPPGPHGPTHFGGLAIQEGRLLSCDFYDGSVWERNDGAWRLLATGLKNPSSLAAKSDGTIYVAEFGSDVISAILP